MWPLASTSGTDIPSSTDTPSPTDTPVERWPSTRRRRRGGRMLVGLLGAAGGVLVLGWFGLRIEPQPLVGASLAPGEVTQVPLPDDLPAPVARFYRILYGEQVPVVESAVISGVGTMRVAGITFPARFRFSHVAGRDYRHYIELTGFGRRLLTVDEWFVDGHARLELPFGVSEGPQVDQGANLALWAEAAWMPSVWVTDPRVSWAPIDETSAQLSVPFGDETETFTVEFDPDTGLLRRMTSMRYRDEAAEDRTLWINEILEWGHIGDRPAPLRLAVTWGDEPTPWAELVTADIVLDADLAHYIRQAGP